VKVASVKETEIAFCRQRAMPAALATLTMPSAGFDDAAQGDLQQGRFFGVL
jgi:hypothetical protein